MGHRTSYSRCCDPVQYFTFGETVDENREYQERARRSFTTCSAADKKEKKGTGRGSGGERCAIGSFLRSTPWGPPSHTSTASLPGTLLRDAALAFPFACVCRDASHATTSAQHLRSSNQRPAPYTLVHTPTHPRAVHGKQHESRFRPSPNRKRKKEWRERPRKRRAMERPLATIASSPHLHPHYTAHGDTSTRRTRREEGKGAWMVSLFQGAPASRDVCRQDKRKVKAERAHTKKKKRRERRGTHGHRCSREQNDALSAEQRDRKKGQDKAAAETKHTHTHTQRHRHKVESKNRNEIEAHCKAEEKGQGEQKHEKHSKRTVFTRHVKGEKNNHTRAEVCT